MKTAQNALAGVLLYVVSTALFVGLLLLTGCSSTKTMSFFNPGPPAPVILAPTSTADQVIQIVNQNTARVRSYVSNNASISVLGLPNLPLLTGNIVYEQPQRFRFSAKSLAGPEVDFGRNDERMWLWAKQMQGPDGRSPLYTVRHDQYAASGVQSVMPLEPRWVIDFLGLVTIPPGAAQPPIPRGENLEVRTLEPSPRGLLTRVFVIDPHGWVIEQSIIDPQGVLLASSTAEGYRYDPVTQVSMPSVVTLRVPAAELGLKIKLGAGIVNAATGDPNQIFQPPVMQNHPVVDLGATAPQQFGAAPLPGDVSPAGWQAQGTALTAPAAVNNPAVQFSPLPVEPVAPAFTPMTPMVGASAPPVGMAPGAFTPPPAVTAPSVYQIPPTGVAIPAAMP